MIDMTRCLFHSDPAGFFCFCFDRTWVPLEGGSCYRLIVQNGKFCLPVQLVNIANSAKDSAQTSKFRSSSARKLGMAKKYCRYVI